VSSHLGSSFNSHLGDLVSAYLDDELDGSEVELVATHLGSCARCTSIVSAEAQVRGWVRGLGAVEPPPGFVEGLTSARTHRRGRHRPRYAAMNLVAAGAVWVAVIAGGRVSSGSVVEPRVGNLVSSHQARTLQAGSLSSEVAMSTETAMSASTREGLPATTSRFKLMAVGHDRRRTQAVYSDGQERVSVFREVGTLNWKGLRDQGALVTVGPTTGVVIERGDVEVLMFERGAYVYAVVAPASTGVIGELAEALPGSPSPSWWERAGDATEGLAECFALQC
jgi:anti-sigma factor RsiW